MSVKLCARCGYKWICPPTLLFALSFCVVGCTGAELIEFGPTNPLSSVQSTAGLIFALGGSDATLYAVSLNAGVWRSKLRKGARAAWEQLPKSPRYAAAIAVDPNNPLHLAVGLRNEDRRDPWFRESGVWESLDGGDNWSYSFSPACANNSQAVPSLTFGRATSSFGAINTTLVVSTACGIYWRKAGSGGFSLSTQPQQLPQVTALVSSASKIWGRTAGGLLLVSLDDGQTFSAATQKPLPQGISFAFRGDQFSLAAFDSAAFMTASPNQPGTVDGILRYQPPPIDAWDFQAVPEENGLASNTGTGLGGQHFIKIFSQVGDPILFYSSGQDVFRLNVGTSGYISTKQVWINTNMQIKPSNPIYQNPVHNDFWDYLFDSKAGVLWLATDGGVWENRGTGWAAVFDGLHTQHLGGLSVMPTEGESRLAYPTTDNNGWWFDGTSWQGGTCCGDLGWVDADSGNPSNALLALRPVGGSTLVPIDPSGSSASNVRMTTDPVANALFLQFIQTLKSERTMALDAVMLVHGPVSDLNGRPVPGVLGQAKGPILIRNRNWGASPDVSAGYAAWSLESSGLPAGTERFWVTNGHANPVYYLTSKESNTVILYRRTGPGRPWEPLFAGVIDRPFVVPFTTCQAQFGAWYGPVFVNPYNMDHVILLTDTGVQVSHNATAANPIFSNDTLLNALLTDSGTYPISAVVCGGGTDKLDGSAVFTALNHSGYTGTLAHVAFSRDDPGVTAVASAFTGAFYDTGNHQWHSLTSLLPHPLSPIIALGLDTDRAYVAFAGRGLVSVTSPSDTVLATYFAQPTSRIVWRVGHQFASLAVLMRTDGAVLGSETVQVTITDPTGVGLRSTSLSSTDGLGNVLVPFLAVRSGNVVWLHFDGDSTGGESDWRFYYP